MGETAVAEPAKPKRRMVKQTESIREKTVKAAQPKPEKKTDVLRLTLHYIGMPFQWIGHKLAKLGKKLGKFKFFRVLGYIVWPKYFRNSVKELRQVTWPTTRETWQLVLAVIIFSVVFGTIIAIVDFGLDKAFKQVLLK
ncbi:MAG TPA: preprotein translocase subunit SecE [Candidatus Pristimantibacillus sp.]|nr:preprotein translocase subunit SecE [Candidatus Pristimantibacillus sp.]